MGNLTQKPLLSQYIITIRTKFVLFETEITTSTNTKVDRETTTINKLTNTKIKVNIIKITTNSFAGKEAWVEDKSLRWKGSMLETCCQMSQISPPHDSCATTTLTHMRLNPSACGHIATTNLLVFIGFVIPSKIIVGND